MIRGATRDGTTPEPGRCATHPTLAAAAECERCGDFACQACLDADYPARCVRCAERLPHGIAWEDPRAGGWPARFVKTVRDVAMRPSVAFPGPARVGASIGFAVLTTLVWATASCLVAAALAWDSLVPMVALALPDTPTSVTTAVTAAALVTATLAMVPLALAWTGLQAGAFAIGLQLAGRRHGAHRVAVRACAYAQAIYLVTTLLDVAGAWVAQLAPASPFGLAVAAATNVLWVLGTARVCRAAGRGLGLTAARATLASLGPIALTAFAAALLTLNAR